MATVALESTGRTAVRGEFAGKRDRHGWGERAERAHEALPHTPPGGKPPETPAPFPSGSIFQNGGNLSRVRKPRNNGAPLTDCLRSEESTEMRERGPSAKRGSNPRRAAEDQSGEDGALRAHEALPHTPPGGKAP
jgi:hypothetical protein